MYVKDMPSVAPSRIDKSTDQIGLDLELDAGLDDRIEAAYAIVELGERANSNKGGVQSPSTEGEEDLDDDTEQYHQVPRSPEWRRQDLRRHFDHSADTSPARTPTKTVVEYHRPRVAHVRGAVMPSRPSGKPVQAVRPKRRMRDDGNSEAIKAKLARMLSEKKNPRGESLKSTSGRNDDVDSEEFGGKFVRTSVALVEPTPFARLPTTWEPQETLPETPVVKSDKVYTADEVKNSSGTLWNESEAKYDVNYYRDLLQTRKVNVAGKEAFSSKVVENVDDSLPVPVLLSRIERSVAEDIKSKSAARDLFNPTSSSESSALPNGLDGSVDEMKESLRPKATEMDGQKTGFLRIEPSMLGVIPSWPVQNYLPQFVFVGSADDMLPDVDNRLWKYAVFPTASSTKAPTDHVIPEFLQNVEVHEPLEMERGGNSFSQQMCRSPVLEANPRSVESRPQRCLPSLVRSCHPQYGSLNSLNVFYNTVVSENAEYPSNLMESKSCVDINRNLKNSPKCSKYQNTVPPVQPLRNDVQSNQRQRPQSSGNTQHGYRAHRPDSLRVVQSRVPKSQRKISAVAQAMEMVKGGEFGSSRALRKFYSSLESGRTPGNSEHVQISEMHKVESQDFPLDLSGYRRRLSRELQTDVKRFPSVAGISCEVSGKLQDKSVSSNELNSSVPANPSSNSPSLWQQNLKVSDSPMTMSQDALAGQPAGGDRGDGICGKSLASSLSTSLPNSHLPPKKRKIRQLSRSFDFPEIETTSSSPVSTTSFHVSSDNVLCSKHLNPSAGRARQCELPTSRTAHPTDSDEQTSLPETRLSLAAEPKVIHRKVAEESSLLSAVAVRDEDGDLPLHIAVVQGSLDVVRKLLPMMSQLGVSVDTCNNNRQTALHLAVISNQPHMVELLLQSLASSNVCDRKGNTAVHLAVKYTMPTCLMHILTNSRIPLDLNAKNYEGLTALHIGVQTSQMDVVKALLANGADANVMDGTNGRTPLFYAVETNDYAMASILLRHGSDPCIASYSGCTPLQIAAAKSFRDMASILERSSQRGHDVAVGFV